MTLKNAAIFLFAASIAGLLGNLLRAGFYISNMGIDFYTLIPTLLLLLALSERVVLMLLALAYKNDRPQSRTVPAIFLSVTGAGWILYYGSHLSDRLFSGPVQDLPYDYLLWCVMIILLSLAQVFFGIAIATGKPGNIRRAALPYVITSGLWALWLLYHLVLNFYHFGMQRDHRLVDLADGMNLVFFTAIFFWGLALFRNSGLSKNDSLIDNL
jgi:hypothetical protein